MNSLSPGARRSLRVALIGLSACVLSFLLAALPPFSEILRQFEARTYDLRVRLTSGGADPATDRILIVDIDRRSVHKLGRYYQWPRSHFISLMEILNAGGARAVVFDVLFDPLDPLTDSLFVDRVKRSGNVYFGLAFTDADSSTFLYPMSEPPPGLRTSGRRIEYSGSPECTWSKDRLEAAMVKALNAARGWGFVNASPDADGVIRRAPLLTEFAGNVYPSLSLSVAAGIRDLPVVSAQGTEHLLRVAGPGNIPWMELPLDGRGSLLLNFPGHFKTFRYLSFYDVLEERVPGELFRDRIVFIGSSFAGLADIKPTAIQEIYPGVEVHATALYNLLQGNPVRSAGALVVVLMVAAMGFGSAFAFGIPRLRKGLLIECAMLAALLTAAALSLGGWQTLVPVVLPCIAAILAITGAITNRFLGEERERKWIHSAFSRYVSHELVQELIRHPEQLSLGGERRELSFLFCDIRSFTSLSEQCEPDELGALLNRYLSVMTELIMEHGGTLDKYIGDAVVAFFGAPVPLPDHARRAAGAALGMQRKLVELREEFAGTVLESLVIGAGVNTGPVLVGNFGSKIRFDYTAIGDAMNLASRLEGLTKHYRCGILVSDNTLRRLDGSHLTRCVDRVRVMGKTEPVDIHQLEDGPPSGVTQEQWRDEYAAALEYYMRGNFEQAGEGFERMLERDPGDGPAAVLHERCLLLGRTPRPDWSGVWVMDRK